MNKDQEQPLDMDMVEEETEEQKDFRETMEDIALSESIDYMRDQFDKETDDKTTSK